MLTARFRGEDLSSYREIFPFAFIRSIIDDGKQLFTLTRGYKDVA